MTKVQAAALQRGIGRFRDKDNVVAAFEMALKNEVRPHCRSFSMHKQNCTEMNNSETVSHNAPPLHQI